MNITCPNCSYPVTIPPARHVYGEEFERAQAEPNRKINEYISALNNVTHASNVERQATDLAIVRALQEIRTELAAIKRNTNHGQA